MNHATKDELHQCRQDIERRVNMIDRRLQKIEQMNETQLEILTQWNNAKGFITIIRAISTTIKVLAVPLVFLAGLWYLITTGHWPK